MKFTQLAFQERGVGKYSTSPLMEMFNSAGVVCVTEECAQSSCSAFGKLNHSWVLAAAYMEEYKMSKRQKTKGKA